MLLQAFRDSRNYLSILLPTNYVLQPTNSLSSRFPQILAAHFKDAVPAAVGSAAGDAHRFGGTWDRETADAYATAGASLPEGSDCDKSHRRWLHSRDRALFFADWVDRTIGGRVRRFQPRTRFASQRGKTLRK